MRRRPFSLNRWCETTGRSLSPRTAAQDKTQGALFTEPHHVYPQPAHSEERERHGFQLGAAAANSATLRHVSKRNCERQRADSFHDLWILRKKATDLIHYRGVLLLSMRRNLLHLVW